MLLVVTKIEYSTIHNTTPYTEETQDSGGGRWTNTGMFSSTPAQVSSVHVLIIGEPVLYL